MMIFPLISAKSKLFYAPSELRFAPNGSDPNSAVFTVIAPRDSIVSKMITTHFTCDIFLWKPTVTHMIHIVVICFKPVKSENNELQRVFQVCRKRRFILAWDRLSVHQNPTESLSKASYTPVSSLKKGKFYPFEREFWIALHFYQLRLGKGNVAWVSKNVKVVRWPNF